MLSSTFGVRRIDDSHQCSFAASASIFAATCLSAYTLWHPSIDPYSSIDSMLLYTSPRTRTATSFRPGTGVCAR